MVVTAAHCSDFVTAPQVQVLTGTQLLDGSGDAAQRGAHHHPPGLEQQHLRQRRGGLGADDRRPRPARHARDRERPGRRRPARHRLGDADRGRLEPDRPPPRRRAARRHRRLQRRQLLQRLDPAQHDLRRADPGRPRQLPGRLGRPADPRAGQRHPDRDRELGQRLRPAEPLRRLHPGVEPVDPHLHRANHRPAIHRRHLQPRRRLRDPERPLAAGGPERRRQDRHRARRRRTPTTCTPGCRTATAPSRSAPSAPAPATRSRTASGCRWT